jgi:hypothetical protein
VVLHESIAERAIRLANVYEPTAPHEAVNTLMWLQLSKTGLTKWSGSKAVKKGSELFKERRREFKLETTDRWRIGLMLWTHS